MKFFNKKPESNSADDIAEVEYLYISTKRFRKGMAVLTDGTSEHEQEKIAHEYKILTLVAKVFAINEFGKIYENPEEVSALYNSFFKRMTAGATELLGITTDEFHNQFRERLKVYNEAWSDPSRNPFEAIGLAFCHLTDCPSSILCLEASKGFEKYLISTFATLKKIKAEYDVIV
jgi:hypothetical protein